MFGIKFMTRFDKPTENLTALSMNNIYFFSHHNPDPKMVKDLGGAIAAQFKGTISEIHRFGNQISFTETLFIGGKR